MSEKTKGLGIILHSGSYDKIIHALQVGISASALEMPVIFFVTYWALKYFQKDFQDRYEFDYEAKKEIELLEKHINSGNIQKLEELLQYAKKLGVKIYACTNSMSLLNISFDELSEYVDKPTGLTTFLIETRDYRIIFI